MNATGLTNRQIMVSALTRMLREAEAGQVSEEAMQRARFVLGEVVRNKRPQYLPKLKPSKQIVDF